MSSEKPIRVVRSADEYYQQLNASPCIVKFTADWCGPCKKMAPLYAQLAVTHGQKIQFLEIDIDKNPELAKEVESIPLFQFYLYGNRVDQLTVRGANTQVLAQNVVAFVNNMQQFIVARKPPPVILERLTSDNVEESGSDFEDYPDPDDEGPEIPEEAEDLQGEPIIEKTISDDLIQSNDSV